MIKAGLLGLGFIGKVHLFDCYNKLEKSEDIKLEAVFDINENNLSDIENVRKYNDLEIFFENEKGKLDFLDICLPTFMHKNIAIKAMEYGFNVLCEKPMALSYEDCVEMIKASEKYNKKLMIAQVLRFDDDYITLKEFIDSGKLGKAKNVKYTSYREGLPQGQNNWFKNTSLSGGSVFDIHIHDADMILNLFGMPETLSTIANKEDAFDGMNSFSTNMFYENDLIINVQCDFSMNNVKHNPGRCIRINFENGYIIKSEEMFICTDKEGKETNLKDLRSKNYYDNKMYYNEIKYYVDCLKNNKNFKLCSPVSSSHSIKLVCSEILSAKEKGKNIKL